LSSGIIIFSPKDKALGKFTNASHHLAKQNALQAKMAKIHAPRKTCKQSFIFKINLETHVFGLSAQRDSRMYILIWKLSQYERSSLEWNVCARKLCFSNLSKELISLQLWFFIYKSGLIVTTKQSVIKMKLNTITCLHNKVYLKKMENLVNNIYFILAIC
jgi:hypothetical protein